MIEGVRVSEIKVKADERGRLCELFRKDDPDTVDFAQVHLTTLYPGVVKAWHRHREKSDVITVVSGMARIGLYDDRRKSKTEGEVNEFYLGIHRPMRLLVPPGVWFGLKCVGPTEALVLVLTDRLHQAKVPDEETLDPEANDIPFDWDLRQH